MSYWRRAVRFVNVAVSGRLEVGGGQLVVPPGSVWYVDPAGSNSNDGRSWDFPFLTVAKALTVAVAGDTIMLAPGDYSEAALTIARAQSKLILIGASGRGGSAIATSTTNGTALTNLANDVTLINVGLAGDGTGGGLTNYGDRLRCHGCKIEGGTWPLILTLGTVAQVAALTHGKGADVLMDDCEFCWAANCVRLLNTDYGAVTQARFRNCKFHNFTASAFEEADGSGGSAAVRFRNLEITDCVFDDNEGGAAPTKYVSLNDDNGNDGIVARCAFPTAINSGLNLVSTALHWVSNYHTGGVSTAQPS